MNDSHEILLSIIIPVFNTERFLRGCLDSVVVPERPEVEVIAIDGGGADDSFCILEEYANRVPRFRLMRQKRNLGLSEDRNLGLTQAHGRFVMFVDSDDTVEPGGLDTLLELLRSQPALDVLRVGFRMVWEDRAYTATIRCLDFHPVSGITAMEYLSEAGAFDPLSQIHIVRRQFLVDHGIRFLPGIYFEDNLFSFEVFWHARAAASRSLYLYRYLQRPGSLSKQSTLTHLKSTVLVSSELGKLKSDDPRAVVRREHSLRSQAENNLRGAILGVSGEERRAFWSWLRGDPRLTQVFETMVPSRLARLLLKYHPRFYYFALKWKNQLLRK